MYKLLLLSLFQNPRPVISSEYDYSSLAVPLGIILILLVIALIASETR